MPTINMNRIQMVEKFLIEEYYYLHKIGLVYASWDKKWAIFSALQYFIYIGLLCFFSIDFFYTAFLCIGDIALFSQSLHIGIVCIVAWTVAVNCAWYRNEIIYVHYKLMNGICDYAKGEFYEGLKNQMVKEKVQLLWFWPLYYGSCSAMAVVIGPMVDTFFGENLGQSPHPQISLRLPISFWIPFDIDGNIFLYIIFCAIEVIVAFIMAIVVAAGVVVCIVVAQYLCLNIELLIYSLETIDLRTQELYNLKEGFLHLKKLDHQIYLKYYNQCLNENIKHHQEILRIYEKVVNIPIFVPFIGGAILLAMAGVHIMSDDARLGPKLTSTTLVVGEMLNMLMLCVYGEKMKQLSEDLRVAIYSIKWHERNRQCCSSVSIIQERTSVPMNIRCLYILEINMETFATVINSAYSYFNLVLAFK